MTHHTALDQKPLASNLEHIAEQRPSSRHQFVLSTRDLGPVPLLPICNPYYELFSGSNMSSSNELDVGTFYPNLYKPRVLLAHHLGQTRNIRNLLVGVYSKYRHKPSINLSCISIKLSLTSDFDSSWLYAEIE